MRARTISTPSFSAVPLPASPPSTEAKKSGRPSLAGRGRGRRNLGRRPEGGGTLGEVAGARPEALQTLHRGAGSLEILRLQRGLAEHADMAVMHDAELVAQRLALLGEAHMDRAAIML